MIFSLQVTAQPKYEEGLRSIFETWGHPSHVPPERIFTVGPLIPGSNSLLHPDGGELWQGSRCQDSDMMCKRLTSIERGFDAIEAGIEYDWLLTGTEDNFIMPDVFWKGFQNATIETPLIVAGFGCSQMWRYAKPGEPMPKDWVDPPSSCPNVEQKGSLCGGNGMLFNRKAVEAFFAKGRESFWRHVERYKESPEKYNSKIAIGLQDDEAVSCLAYDLGIAQSSWSHASLNQDYEDQGSAIIPGKEQYNTYFGIWHIANTPNVSKVMHEFYQTYIKSKGDH